MIRQFHLIKPSRVTQSDKAKARFGLIRECDALIRPLVLARDKVCQRCGSDKNLQDCHVLPKGRVPRLRFELLNHIVLCMSCHLFWWHKAPLAAAEWFEDKFPGRTKLLLELAATAKNPDLKELVLCLRVEVANLK